MHGPRVACGDDGTVMPVRMMAAFLLLALAAATAGALEQRVNVWKGIEYARPPQRWAVAEM
jgi:hypothetical protein